MKSALSSHLALLLLLGAPPALARRQRRCYYMNYPPTRPGHDLKGPTHTCECSSSGRWKNCRRNPSSSSSSSEDGPGTIVDVAIAAGFDTLVAAVSEAGLVDALSGDGPFTVFAPTDDAFAALPVGALDTLLADSTGLLTDVLLYHVVEGKVEADDIPSRLRAETLLGEKVTLRNDGGSVTVNDVDVIAADVDASNGVIHVIDQVLIPNSVADALEPGTIVDVAVAAGFDTLVDAVAAAGLVDALSGDGPLTVFAPTDEAFAALPSGFLDGLLEDTDLLTRVLLYHVVAGKVEATDIPPTLETATLEGDAVLLRNRGGEVTVNRQADVVAADVAASNGVIHVIDRVLVPEGVLDVVEPGVFPTCS